MSIRWLTQMRALTCLVVVAAGCAPAAISTSTPMPTAIAATHTATLPPTSTVVPTQPGAAATVSQARALPAARGYSRLVYDERADQVLMFGGFKTMAMNADLWDIWSLDSRTFTWRLDRQEDAFSLPYNYDCLALDAQSQKVIVYTIEWDDAGQATGVVQTWAYDIATATWVQMAPAVQPPARWGSRMVYDSKADRLLLFGGTDAVTFVTLADTWAYDVESDAWVQLQTTGSITPLHFFDMAYVPEVDRTILFGGLTSPGGDKWTLMGDTWAFDFNTLTWAKLKPQTPPAPRAYQTLVYDPISGDLIQYGGTLSHENYPAEPTTDETWRYSVAENAWHRVITAVSPGKRAWHQAVGTPAGLILFGGGESRSDYVNDTWLFSPEDDTWRKLP